VGPVYLGALNLKFGGVFYTFICEEYGRGFGRIDGNSPLFKPGLDAVDLLL